MGYVLIYKSTWCIYDFSTNIALDHIMYIFNAHERWWLCSVLDTRVLNWWAFCPKKERKSIIWLAIETSHRMGLLRDKIRILRKKSKAPFFEMSKSQRHLKCTFMGDGPSSKIQKWWTVHHLILMFLNRSFQFNSLYVSQFKSPHIRAVLHEKRNCFWYEVLKPN